VDLGVLMTLLLVVAAVQMRTIFATKIMRMSIALSGAPTTKIGCTFLVVTVTSIIAGELGSTYVIV